MFIFRQRYVSVMILSAVVLHFLWAGCVFYSDDALGPTGVAALARYIPAVILPWSILTAAVLALVALSLRPAWFLLMLMPQQILLLMSASGAIEAIWLGQFADGVVRSRVFLLADQFYSILVCIGHTTAIALHAWRITRG